MAIYKEDIVDFDLETGTVHRSFSNKIIGEGDVLGNRYGVRCYRNGQPESLVGSTVIGQFIRADGNTITINGGYITGNTAYVTLPEACYAVEGNFTLIIKLEGGGVTGTIRVVDGTVINTTNGNMIDPGNVIPDLSDYLAVIEDAEEAAETIYGMTVTANLISGEDYDITVVKE